MKITMFGKVFEIAQGSSAGDILKAERPDEFKQYLAVKLEDGEMADLFRPIEKDQGRHARYLCRSRGPKGCFFTAPAI